MNNKPKFRITKSGTTITVRRIQYDALQPPMVVQEDVLFNIQNRDYSDLLAALFEDVKDELQFSFKIGKHD